MSSRVYPPNGKASTSSSDPPNTRKIIVIGDEGCGKTSLVKTFLGDFTPGSTAFYMCREYVTEVEIQDEMIPIKICDIPGSDVHKHLRGQCYYHADAAILCFAIDDPESLFHAETEWLLEVSTYCPSLRYILAGLKRDLRTDEATIQRLDELVLKPVSYQQGLEVKDKYFFDAYIECAIDTKAGIREVFELATISAMTPE